MIRQIDVSEITDAVRGMCIEANYGLSEDMKACFLRAEESEEAPLGKKILAQLQENLEIAKTEEIPICQDTGMTVVFLEIGQNVHFFGGDLTEAINEGVRQGYETGYLRKSVVGDPIERVNTKDNTPAVIHTKIVPGDQVKITVAPKGFGSENMSRIFMLKPAEGIEGVKNAVLTAVKDAGPNACPPMVVGVGIGGTFEKAALLAKEALTREISAGEYENSVIGAAGTDGDAVSESGAGEANDENGKRPRWVRDLEQELLIKINGLGIGPGGLGGRTTAFAVHVNTYPTHIAGLPVAVNICCHVNRHVTKMI